MRKVFNRALIFMNLIYRFIILFPAKKFANNNYTEIVKSFNNFKLYGQISSKRQPIKGYDLWKHLLNFKPKNIVELGSGTTSAIFSLYAKIYNSKYVAFESFEKWRDVTIKSISHISSDDNILFIPSQIDENNLNTHFIIPIPNNVDFLYIDGPPCTLPNGKKVPNNDIIIAFDNYILPKFIIIDGRHETIELIKNHENFKFYKFLPSFSFSLNNKLYWQALFFREHSIFIKID
jgi:hypothetical protein